MVDLFLEKNSYSYRLKISPNTENVYNRLRNYISRLKEYYYGKYNSVNNSNVIVSLLKTLSINPSWSNMDIYNHIRVMKTDIVKPFNLSNEIYINVLDKNASIIKGSKEIVYTVDGLSMLDCLKVNILNYRELTPLVFRNHPFKDLNFNHPSRIILDSSDMIVYDIDLLSLALMYKHYALELEDDESGVPSVQDFVSRFVYTNTLESLADITILNNYLGKGYLYLDNKHSIGTTMTDIYTKQLEDVISDSLVNEPKIFIIELLRNIKLLYTEDAYELLFISKIYETRMSRVYIALTLFDFLKNILNLINIKQASNGGYVSKLKWYIKVMMSSNISLDNETIDNVYKYIIEDLRSK